MDNLGRNCPKCSRKLLETALDKCMYCGAIIPPELQLSTKEKVLILEKNKNAHEDSELTAKKLMSRKWGEGPSYTGDNPFYEVFGAFPIDKDS